MMRHTESLCVCVGSARVATGLQWIGEGGEGSARVTTGRQGVLLWCCDGSRVWVVVSTTVSAAGKRSTVVLLKGVFDFLHAVSCESKRLTSSSTVGAVNPGISSAPTASILSICLRTS